MAVTRKTIVRGMGALTLRQISTGRVLSQSLNASFTFSKSTDEGDTPKGVNSSGVAVDLDAPSKAISFGLEVATKKNSRNVNELLYNSGYAAKTSYNVPWAEVQTVTGGSVTLNGSATPVTGTMVVSYLDGDKLTSTGTTPSAAGTFKNNNDGTITFHAGDNGKQVAILYMMTLATATVQGGADDAPLGDLEAILYRLSGTSNVTNKVGVDILWLPKCSISGDLSEVFSEETQDKTFSLKPVVPDTPAGWTVPYQWIRDVEIDNRNAG